MIPRFQTHLLLVAAMVTTIGCDRVTKHVASATLAGAAERSFLADTVRLVYVENTGGFLSLGADLPEAVRSGLFTFGVGLMLVAMVVVAIRSRWTGWPLLGMTFFVAGGASNWVDRVMSGAVVDFLNVGLGPLRTGVFNVADVAIMVGAGIVVVAELLPGRPPPQNPAPPHDPAPGDSPTSGL